MTKKRTQDEAVKELKGIAEKLGQIMPPRRRIIYEHIIKAHNEFMHALEALSDEEKRMVFIMIATDRFTFDLLFKQGSALRAQEPSSKDRTQ